jgi:MFS family permease
MIELRNQRAILMLLAFAMLIVSLDQYIVVVALPEIARALDFSDQTLQTVISAYAVASAGFLLFGGRAADLLGRRRIFIAGLTLYAVGSLIGGLAPAPHVLLVARATQGLGGALVFPATLSIVNTTFAEGAARNRALAVWGGAGAAGLVIGVLLGGLLTQLLGWEAIFFVSVPLATAAAVLAFWLVPADGPRVSDRRFDLPGAISATAGVTLLIVALVEGPQLGWTSPPILASAALGTCALIGLVAIERRSRDPLAPPHLVANRTLRTAVVIAFLFWATFGSVLYFLTLYFQDVQGFGALETGIAFLLPTAVVLGGSAAAGHLVTSIGLRQTLVGSLAIGSLGALALGVAMSAGSSYAGLVPGLVGISIGDGIVFTTMFIAAGTGVSDAEQGTAAGITSTSTSIGAAVGLALLVLVANADTEGIHGEALSQATAEGLSRAVYVIAAAIAATALVALTLRREIGRISEAPCPRQLAPPLKIAKR